MLRVLEMAEEAETACDDDEQPKPQKQTDKAASKMAAETRPRIDQLPKPGERAPMPRYI
jgi:hypothetical protein